MLQSDRIRVLTRPRVSFIYAFHLGLLAGRQLWPGGGARDGGCLSACVAVAAATRLWVDVLKIFTHGSWLAGWLVGRSSPAKHLLAACTEIWFSAPQRAKATENHPCSFHLELWLCTFRRLICVENAILATLPIRPPPKYATLSGGITREKLLTVRSLWLAIFHGWVCVCGVCFAPGECLGFLIRIFVGLTLHSVADGAKVSQSRVES